ncbi:ATP-dependent DNA helicase DinG [Neisseriaceae bacterium B1]
MLTDLEKNAIRDHYRAISENLPHFRPRAAQREMLAAIANAFSRTLERQEGEDAPKREGESIVVVEGPTGVGKSLAYLLAGGIMAQARGKRLIVSSATVALQEQLVGRDLPFVVAHSGLDMTFALAKGRGRYLCPYKLFQLTQTNAQQSLAGMEAPVLWETKPKKEDLETLHEMAEAFAARRFNGDRDTWAAKIDDGLWQQVTNDRHGCLKNACPNRPECPFFLARDTLETVDVVVANHDLLLSDISMGGGVILPAPENSFYCIDEAHHLPKKALSRFAAEHSWLQAVWTMEKLPAQTAKIATVCDKVELANLADEAAASMLECLNEWQFHLQDAPELSDEGEHENIWLWEDGNIPDGLETLVQNSFISAQSLLKNINGLNDALSAARREKDQDSAQIDRITSEFGIFVARAEQIAAVWELMATTPKDDKEPPLAKWITRVRDDKLDWMFNASPISSAAMLASGLWRRASGALLTSATLQSLGNFNLLLQQTGLSWLPETTTLALQSPFDFQNQGELYIPPLNASPKDPAAHTDAIVQWLPKLISETAPIGTLVLFTSRKQMQEIAFRLPENYLPLILMQGEQSKTKLLEQHYAALKDGKASIIFGLDSFAEGLDLPGEACVHVIIAKLPFSMPDNPIEKTQSRWIEKRGGRPFMEITVPEASIKLVQAVGRLIRTEQDYGRVTILDNRILTAQYGRQLLACLPPFKRIG